MVDPPLDAASLSPPLPSSSAKHGARKLGSAVAKAAVSPASAGKRAVVGKAARRRKPSLTGMFGLGRRKKAAAARRPVGAARRTATNASTVAAKKKPAPQSAEASWDSKAGAPAATAATDETGVSSTKAPPKATSPTEASARSMGSPLISSAAAASGATAAFFFGDNGEGAESAVATAGDAERATTAAAAAAAAVVAAATTAEESTVMEDGIDVSMATAAAAAEAEAETKIAQVVPVTEAATISQGCDAPAISAAMKKAVPPSMAKTKEATVPHDGTESTETAAGDEAAALLGQVMSSSAEGIDGRDGPPTVGEGDKSANAASKQVAKLPSPSKTMKVKAAAATSLRRREAAEPPPLEDPPPRNGAADKDGTSSSAAAVGGLPPPASPEAVAAVKSDGTAAGALESAAWGAAPAAVGVAAAEEAAATTTTIVRTKSTSGDARGTDNEAVEEFSSGSDDGVNAASAPYPASMDPMRRKRSRLSGQDGRERPDDAGETQPPSTTPRRRKRSTGRGAGGAAPSPTPALRRKTRSRARSRPRSSIGLDEAQAGADDFVHGGVGAVTMSTMTPREDKTSAVSVAPTSGTAAAATVAASVSRRRCARGTAAAGSDGDAAATATPPAKSTPAAETTSRAKGKRSGAPSRKGRLRRSAAASAQKKAREADNKEIRPNGEPGSGAASNGPEETAPTSPRRAAASGAALSSPIEERIVVGAGANGLVATERKTSTKREEQEPNGDGGGGSPSPRRRPRRAAAAVAMERARRDIAAEEAEGGGDGATGDDGWAPPPRTTPRAAATSSAPTGKSPVAVTSSAPAGKSPAAVTSGAPAGKSPAPSRNLVVGKGTGGTSGGAGGAARKEQICPHCGTKFASRGGLKYHVERRVCLPAADPADGDAEEKPAVAKTASKTRGRGGDGGGGGRSQSPPRERSVSPIRSDEYDDGDYSDGSDCHRNVRKKSKASKKSASGGMLVCSDCGAEFNSRWGYQYHTTRGVCKRAGSIARATVAAGDEAAGHKVCVPERGGAYDPFGLLRPGERFITKYGIAEVVSDDRPPPLVVAGQDPEESARARREELLERVGKKKKSYLELVSQKKYIDRVYKRYRKKSEARKRKLNELYMRSDGNAMMQQAVWMTHYPKAKKMPAEILARKTDADAVKVEDSEGVLDNGAAATQEEMQDNIVAEPDIILHPDRFVECILVRDERKWIRRYEDEMDKRGVHENAVSCSTTTSSLKPPIVMRLYLPRHLLSAVYKSSVFAYKCAICGRIFNSRDGWKSHCDNRICTRPSKVTRPALTKPEHTAKTSTKPTPTGRKRNAPKRSIKELSGSLGVNSKKRKTDCCKDSTVGHEDMLGTDPTTTNKGMTLRGAPRKNRDWSDHQHKPWMSVSKRKRRPSWLEFRPKESCWYVEIFKTLQYKRGSNNTKWKVQKKEKSKFQPVVNARKKRKWKVRMEGKALYPSVVSGLGFLKGSKDLLMYPNVFESLGFQVKVHQKPNRGKQLRSRGTALDDPDIVGDEDRNYETYREFADRLLLDEKAKLAEEARQLDIEKAKEEANEKRRKRARISLAAANPKPRTPLVDIMVLMEEVDVGRYPSITRFLGQHSDSCALCHDDGEPLQFCAVCSNAEHWECLQWKQNVHRSSTEDDFLCHVCVGLILSRRKRAEKRRLEKRESAFKETSAAAPDSDVVNELLHSAQPFPEASNAEADGAKIKLASPMDPGKQFDRSQPGVSVCDQTGPLQLPPLLPTTEATLSAREPEARLPVDHLESGLSVDAAISFQPCPNNGPGGLICCSFCTASYSRMLSTTTEEIEVRKVAKVGREVSEIMDLLRDAQTRLRRAVNVSRENKIRRRLMATSEASKVGDIL